MGKDFIIDQIESTENELKYNGIISDNEVNIKKLNKVEKEKIRKALKKKKKKLRKRNKDYDGEDISSESDNEELLNPQIITSIKEPLNSKDIQDIQVEYVERDEYLLTGKYYEEFKNVFQYFSSAKQSLGLREEEEEQDQDEFQGQTDQIEGEQQQAEQNLSRKKRKLLKRLKVAQLKALVKRPDVIEVELVQ